MSRAAQQARDHVRFGPTFKRPWYVSSNTWRLLVQEFEIMQKLDELEARAAAVQVEIYEDEARRKRKYAQVRNYQAQNMEAYPYLIDEEP